MYCSDQLSYDLVYFHIFQSKCFIFAHIFLTWNLFKRVNECVILQKATKDDSNGGNSMARDTKKVPRRAKVYSFVPTGEDYSFFIKELKPMTALIFQRQKNIYNVH